MSRAVAQDAAERSGLDPGLLQKMLPMLAMLVAGFMAKQQNAGVEQTAPAGGGLGDMLGGCWAAGPPAQEVRRPGP